MNIIAAAGLYVMALMMTAAGIMHFIKPQFYLPIVPEWLPFRMAIIYGSGLLELVAGIGLFIPAFRQPAALLVLILMMIFLPVHGWDCFRPHPAMGSTTRAAVRFVLQFGLIAWAWWLLQSAETVGLRK